MARKNGKDQYTVPIYREVHTLCHLCSQWNIEPMYTVEHIHLWDKIQVACSSQSYFNRQQFVKIGVLLYCKPRHVNAVHIFVHFAQCLRCTQF